jgi:hypothetical protein
MAKVRKASIPSKCGQSFRARDRRDPSHYLSFSAIPENKATISPWRCSTWWSANRRHRSPRRGADGLHLRQRTHPDRARRHQRHAPGGCRPGAAHHFHVRNLRRCAPPGTIRRSSRPAGDPAILPARVPGSISVDLAPMRPLPCAKTRSGQTGSRQSFAATNHSRPDIDYGHSSRASGFVFCRIRVVQ